MATGKRGHVIEGLYLKVEQPGSTQTFAFWGYGERNSSSSTIPRATRFRPCGLPSSADVKRCPHHIP